MKLKIYFIVLASLLTSACGNYLEKKEAPTVENSNQSNMGVDFARVQAEIFSPRCVSCHQQYANYPGVKREVDSIFSAVDANRMPKNSAPLPDNLKQLLQEWIANGAPEVVGQVVQPPQEVVLEPQWKSIFENIISSKCLACHNPTGQAKFMDLSSRQAIFASRNRLFGEGDGKKLINFEQPDQSYLLDVIRDPVEPMPPIWSNIRRLNENEIKVLSEWIGLGLP